MSFMIGGTDRPDHTIGVLFWKKLLLNFHSGSQDAGPPPVGLEAAAIFLPRKPTRGPTGMGLRERQHLPTKKATKSNNAANATSDQPYSI